MENYQIFDVHHHVGFPRQISSTMETIAGQELEDEIKTRLEAMDSAHVSQALINSTNSYERPNGIADTRNINDIMASYRDKHPDRFPYATGHVDPNYGSSVCIDEIRRCREELHFIGMQFHTLHLGVSMDSPIMERLIGAIVDNGMLPVVHAAPDNKYEAIWKTARLARMWPDAKILVLDAFGTHEGLKESADAIERASNLYFDTGLAYTFGAIQETIVREFGADRVLFGSDTYSRPTGSQPMMGRGIHHIARQIVESELSESDKEAILGGNARALFAEHSGT